MEAQRGYSIAPGHTLSGWNEGTMPAHVCMTPKGMPSSQLWVAVQTESTGGCSLGQPSLEDRSWGLTHPLHFCATHSARCGHAAISHRPKGEFYSDKVFSLHLILPVRKLKLERWFSGTRGKFQVPSSDSWVQCSFHHSEERELVLLLLYFRSWLPDIFRHLILCHLPHFPLPWPLSQGFANPQCSLTIITS